MVLQYVDILFANETEAKAFTSKEPEEALNEISKMVDIAVVKIGSKGSIIKKGNETFKVGVIKANSVDTTGAGDLYAAGFIYGLAKGYNLETCGKIGSLLAGNIIEVTGAKLNTHRWENIYKEIAKL